MRNCTSIAVFAIALLCLSEFAQAQPGRGGRGGAGGRGMQMNAAMLLRAESVRSELDLNDDQVAQIEDMMQSFGGRGGRGGAGGRPGQRGEDGQPGQGGGNADDAQAKLAEILNEEQMGRLNEIRLQVMGPGALLDPKVAEKVGLSDDDVEKVETALEDANAEVRERAQEIMFGGGGDREAMMKEMMNLRKEIMGGVLDVLSTAQKDKFTQMQGETFELDMRELMGGRGGRGGQGGRGAGGRGGDGGRGGAGGRGGGDGQGGRGGRGGDGGRPGNGN